MVGSDGERHGTIRQSASYRRPPNPQFRFRDCRPIDTFTVDSRLRQRRIYGSGHYIWYAVVAGIRINHDFSVAPPRHCRYLHRSCEEEVTEARCGRFRLSIFILQQPSRFRM
jgi:hypothetical protein